jgi:16S rRNA (cytidine1402-2'-O)-methyltransferase
MGILYVVATPIGNLEDITLRALRVLREVQVIAAEDTRRTAKLLQHYSISTPTTSLHEHNEAEKTGALVARLAAGADIALVSDAGTPLVSDPGKTLVRAAREAGQTVIPIPGPNAIMTVLAGSGVEAQTFCFLGFPPRKSLALKKWLSQELMSQARTAVIYEAPHRIRLTLTAMLDVLGDRPIILGRELTKLHEELVERTISGHLAHLRSPKGEFTIVVPPPQAARPAPKPPLDDVALADELGRMIENDDLSPREAARRLASKYSLPVNVVYRTRTRKP